MLKLENIRKSFANINIGPIDLAIDDNQFISLIGESGAGKTTVIKMLAGIIKQDSGSITFNNQQIEISDITYVTQKSMLFNHLRIIENFELWDVDLTNLDQVLTSLNLDLSIKNYYPFEISGGQAQRINFARVLLNNSKIVLLDEAFSALDVNTKDEIYDLIYRLKEEENLTFIMVTHDIQEAVLLSDHIILMDHGQVEFNGTAKDLLTMKSKAISNLISDNRRKMLAGLL